MFTKVLTPISRYVPTGLRLEYRNIQWGLLYNLTYNSDVTFPIAFRTVFSISGNDTNTEGDPLVLAMNFLDNTKFKVSGRRIQRGIGNIWGHWIAVGIA